MPLSASFRTNPSQAGICFLCIVYVYFRVPEPTGRTFAELDLLFSKGISARKFAETKVDVFADEAASLDSAVLNKYEKGLDISQTDSKTSGGAV